MGSSSLLAGSLDLELPLELTFECVGNPLGLRRLDLVQTPLVIVERATGTVGRPAVGTAKLPPRQGLLVITRQGAVVARSAPRQPIFVIPPMSVALLGPGHYALLAGRGEHSAEFIRFDLTSNPAIEQAMRPKWLVSVGNRPIYCRSLEGPVLTCIQRYDHVIERGMRSQLDLLSIAYELVALLHVAEPELILAVLPNDLPETILDLTKRVRLNPASPWPLKLAADMAGYSPFHFSRVFKQLVGYGFHEYVDRRRTEMAIAQVTLTDQSIEAVAAQCGFGTTQGLRESIKEYLGLVPSELRPSDLADIPRP